MIILVIIVWLLLGAISVWRFYHGMLREFYNDFGISIWSEEEGKKMLKRYLFHYSPFFVLAGAISLLAYHSVLPKGFACWWYTTKNKK